MKYKISDLSKILGVSTNTLRRYEELGYFESKRCKDSKYRYFSEGDIIKIMSVRLQRKYGFTHDQLNQMKDYDIASIIQEYDNKLNQMDKQINYLSSLRHRMKDNLILMNKIDVFMQPEYMKECQEFSYIIYKNGTNLLNEPRRIKSIQDYLYLCPEVQMIYLIRKDDIDNNSVAINMGWAIKTKFVDRFNIEQNEFTEKYEKKMCLLSLVKIPIDAEIQLDNSTQVKEIIVDDIIKQLKKNNFKLDGDILGIIIAIAKDGGKQTQYVLVSAPIIKL